MERPEVAERRRDDVEKIMGLLDFDEGPLESSVRGALAYAWLRGHDDAMNSVRKLERIHEEAEEIPSDPA